LRPGFSAIGLAAVKAAARAFPEGAACPASPERLAWLAFVAPVTNLTYIPPTSARGKGGMRSKQAIMNIDSTKLEETGLREIWSVHDFAQRYRLDRMEESRLKMLHGRFAAIGDLLASRPRASVF
jgi:hypothetical protein